MRCCISTYLIGDVQGCYRELQVLLSVIDFNPDRDRLGFVGDLVNRGPESLATLRFIKQLKDPLIVLGNHDLYLLAINAGCIDVEAQHLLQPILEAEDKLDLLEWLRHLPLLIREDFGVMVHAGIPPQWSIEQALQHAREVEVVLQSDSINNMLTQYEDFLTQLVGNQPDCWNFELSGFDRWRYIVNALTRMRFCGAHGELDLISKRSTTADPSRFKPWFEWYHGDTDIFFGHWADLKGQCDHPHVYALDTACVWGEKLTAIRIEDRQLFSVP